MTKKSLPIFFVLSFLAAWGAVFFLSSLPWNARADAGSSAFNGTIYDSLRTASLANYPTAVTLTGVNSIGALISEHGSRWAAASAPASGTIGSASIAAEANVRHVADCIFWSAAATSAPTLTQTALSLRDGATGAGTVLQKVTIVIPASTGTLINPGGMCGLNLVGTTNTAMTFEWTAGITNVFEAANITGFNIN